VRRNLASKHWTRTRNRTNQILHAATNFLVDAAVKEGAAIILEELTGIRRMYHRGNGHGADYRFRLNSWPYSKAYRMLQYKSAWKGITMISLTKSETYGSSSMCATCGERLHAPEKGDAEHKRMLWCQACKEWVDRDANAAIVLSERGLARFDSPLPQSPDRSQKAFLSRGDEGLAVEALKGNETATTPILRVDAGKLSGGHGQTLYSAGHSPPT
jgi:putative transposase